MGFIRWVESECLLPPHWACNLCVDWPLLFFSWPCRNGALAVDCLHCCFVEATVAQEADLALCARLRQRRRLT